MKPVKALQPIAIWLLRFATILIVYSRFWSVPEKTNIESVYFYFALAMTVFTLGLLLGGLLKKNATTIFSGIGILGVSLALMFIGGFTLGKLFENFVLAALGFYFVSRGNS